MKNRRLDIRLEAELQYHVIYQEAKDNIYRHIVIGKLIYGIINGKTGYAHKQRRGYSTSYSEHSVAIQKKRAELYQKNIYGCYLAEHSSSPAFKITHKYTLCLRLTLGCHRHGIMLFAALKFDFRS